MPVLHTLKKTPARQLFESIQILYDYELLTKMEKEKNIAVIQQIILQQSKLVNQVNEEKFKDLIIK